MFDAVVLSLSPLSSVIYNLSQGPEVHQSDRKVSLFSSQFSYHCLPIGVILTYLGTGIKNPEFTFSISFSMPHGSHVKFWHELDATNELSSRGPK